MKIIPTFKYRKADIQLLETSSSLQCLSKEDVMEYTRVFLAYPWTHGWGFWLKSDLYPNSGFFMDWGLAKLKPEEGYSIKKLYRPYKTSTAGRDFIPFLIKVDALFPPPGIPSGKMTSVDHHPRVKSPSSNNQTPAAHLRTDQPKTGGHSLQLNPDLEERWALMILKVKA